MKMQRWSCRFVGIVGIALIGCGQEPSTAEDQGVVPGTSGALTIVTGDPVVAATQDVTVTVPVQFNEPYSGMAQSEFPDGLPLSVGSGLRFRRDGAFFYGLGDRGPNGDAPAYLDSANVSHPTKAYLVPEYAPKIITMAASDAGVIVTSTVPIRAGGVPVTGLPPAALTNEIALSETLSALPSSTTGIVSSPAGVKPPHGSAASSIREAARSGG